MHTASACCEPDRNTIADHTNYTDNECETDFHEELVHDASLFHFGGCEVRTVNGGNENIDITVLLDGQLELIVWQQILVGKEDRVGRSPAQCLRQLVDVDQHTANARLTLRT